MDVRGPLLGHGAFGDWLASGRRVVVAHEQAGLFRQGEQAADRVVQLGGAASREVAASGADIRREQGVTDEYQRLLDLERQIRRRMPGHVQGAGAQFADGEGLVGLEQVIELAVHDAIANVRAQVGDAKVLLGLSGGVDSSVVAALLHQAIGDQLTCVFVDNGLLRLHEGEQVMAMFAENMGVKVIRANAEDKFLSRLLGVTDPEDKRKIIGRTFIEVFDEEATKLQGIKYLAQGTIYPDVIESAGAKTGKAHVIKSHHNVGGLPEDMQFELVEPLRELFKDEVRKIGLELGLPYDMVYRHPFPGPGLGVRILAEVRKEYADILRRADHIFIEELRKADLYQQVSQAFAVFLPVKSVGVVGDGRRYEWVIALRAVETIDFMTARWAHLPYEFLETVSNRIINEITGVSRVTYDISSKPPATIEWE